MLELFDTEIKLDGKTIPIQNMIAMTSNKEYEVEGTGSGFFFKVYDDCFTYTYDLKKYKVTNQQLSELIRKYEHLKEMWEVQHFGNFKPLSSK
jgi:acid stress-induced BolA-like protein IbaG/YrbA